MRSENEVLMLRAKLMNVRNALYQLFMSSESGLMVGSHPGNLSPEEHFKQECINNELSKQIRMQKWRSYWAWDTTATVCNAFGGIVGGGSFNFVLNHIYVFWGMLVGGATLITAGLFATSLQRKSEQEQQFLIDTQARLETEAKAAQAKVDGVVDKFIDLIASPQFASIHKGQLLIIAGALGLDEKQLGEAVAKIESRGQNIPSIIKDSVFGPMNALKHLHANPNKLDNSIDVFRFLNEMYRWTDNPTKQGETSKSNGAVKMDARPLPEEDGPPINWPDS